jgi:hypothetical protein
MQTTKMPMRKNPNHSNGTKSVAISLVTLINIAQFRAVDNTHTFTKGSDIQFSKRGHQHDETIAPRLQAQA